VLASYPCPGWRVAPGAFLCLRCPLPRAATDLPRNPLTSYLVPLPSKVATLYLVSTPIGNLSDMTRRALDVLRAADVVFAEDTRRTGLLLRHYGIEARLISAHEHNEAARAGWW
jgi:hypothetical protein